MRTTCLVPAAVLLIAGCGDPAPQGPARTDAARGPMSVAPTGMLTAECTAAPEPTTPASRGTPATLRSSHTWKIVNPTAEPRDFVVVLEISDDRGHVKKKEVPGQVKANATLEDSTSIALTTTYHETGPVQGEVRTTVKVDSRSIAVKSAPCSLEVR